MSDETEIESALIAFDPARAPYRRTEAFFSQQVAGVADALQTWVQSDEFTELVNRAKDGESVTLDAAVTSFRTATDFFLGDLEDDPTAEIVASFLLRAPPPGGENPLTQTTSRPDRATDLVAGFFFLKSGIYALGIPLYVDFPTEQLVAVAIDGAVNLVIAVGLLRRSEFTRRVCLVYSVLAAVSAVFGMSHVFGLIHIYVVYRLSRPDVRTLFSRPSDWKLAENVEVDPDNPFAPPRSRID